MKRPRYSAVTSSSMQELMMTTMARLFAAALFVIGSASVAAASEEPLVLTGEVTVGCEADAPAVSLAVADLLTDLKRVLGKPARLVAASEAALEELLAVRQRAARGRWNNWYRGDKKVNTPRMLQRVRSLRATASASKRDE